MAGNQEFAPDSYWQAVKDRMRTMAAAPGNAVRGLVAPSNGAGIAPNARPGVPTDALPASASPQEIAQKEAIARALMQQQMQQQQQMSPQQAAPVNPQNPAGIQF